MPSKELTIGVAWQPRDSGNLGVLALAEANILIALQAAQRADRTLAFVEFCSSDWGPGTDIKYKLVIADPPSIKRMLTGQSNFYSLLKRCDVVLDIGAGDSFADIYGEKHFFFIALSKVLTLVAGRPLVFSPQTIGPFGKPWCRNVAHWLLRRADRVFTRDKLSLDYLQERGLAGNSEQVTDVAFRLQYQPLDLPPTAKTRVGINVSGLLYNGGYTQNNQFGLALDYKDFTNRLLADFTSRTDCEIHLVGHVFSDSLVVEDDYRVLLELQKHYPTSIVAPRFTSPSEAKGYIAAMDFFMGARMHACIAAFSSGVPVIPLAYSRKFKGLFNALDYMHIVDLKIENIDGAMSKIMHSFETRDALKEAVAHGNALTHEKLQRYEDYLVTLFQRVP